MASEELKIDSNNKPVIGAVTDDSNQYIKMLRIDDTTKGLKVSIVGGGGTGTVTSITQGTGILLTPSPITSTGSVALSAAIQPIATLGSASQQIRVNAGATALEYFTPSASGTVTSVSVTTANGVSGSVATATTTPAITLTLGSITPTSVNGLTITANGTNTLSIQAGKTLTANGSITLTGTDAQTYTFPTTSATIARTDAANTFTGVQTFSTPIASASMAAMTATVGGRVPTPPNNTTTFLRGDGTFAAPAGGAGAVTWAGGDAVERSGTTTGADAITLSSVTGLSIAAGTPIWVVVRWRKSTGAASAPRIGIKINSTQVISTAENVDPFKLSPNNAAASGYLSFWLTAGDANYTGTLMAGGNWFNSNSGQGAWWTANSGTVVPLPNGAITSITLTGDAVNSSQTMYTNNLNVYTYATS